MKKFLPAFFKSTKGFTLIELLVVISIIAVLSLIGIALFTGVQPKARNDRRRADLDAIVKALEVNKAPTGYIALANTQFNTGAIPTTDPQTYPYCANSTASSQPADPAIWTTTCPANYGTVGTNPPAGTTWKVCASLEAEGAVPATVFCRVSSQ